MLMDNELTSMLIMIVGVLLINAFLLMLIKLLYGQKPSKYGGDNEKKGRRKIALSMIFILLLVLLDVFFILYMIPGIRYLLEDKLYFFTSLF